MIRPDDEMRSKLKELYERREVISEQITEMHRKFDALRDVAIKPLSDQCNRLDDAMTDLVVSANVTWVEGKFAADGLPALEPV